MTIYMKRKKVIDTNQYVVITRESYEDIDRGRWAEQNPWPAKPRAVTSCSLLETREALIMLQVCFIDLEKRKKILARNSLRVSPV